MERFKTLIAICMLCISLQACLQEVASNGDKLLTGAMQTGAYLPLLHAKKVALVSNHASLIGRTHLADSLLSLDVDLVKIFAPEHGFRGIADAGELIDHTTDSKTGLPVVSLYGSNKKPSPASLENVDIILFDLQDVGARFYTYIYTLTYIMEAAAGAGIPVIVLDRPNPNGFYVDGPVLEKEYSSFVGMHPVPVVYGMTIGEYGRMVNGEFWIHDSLQCDLEVIPLKNYDRGKLYKLPVRPSPNLPDWKSVYLYPSLCLFEGTVMSVGRGTDHPFTVYGHPDFLIGSFAFTPEPRQGAKYPRLEGKQCFGQNLEEYAENYDQAEHHFNLSWLINAFKELGSDSSFFTPYFDKLAGTFRLREQILSGTSEEKIRSSWQEDLDTFMEIRKKYLIYKDFKNADNAY